MDGLCRVWRVTHENIQDAEQSSYYAEIEADRAGGSCHSHSSMDSGPPITWLAISSITPYIELISDRMTHWFPENPTLANFKVMFDLSKQTGQRFVYALRNSLIISSCVTIICLVAGTLAAYALARLPVRRKKRVSIVAYVNPNASHHHTGHSILCNNITH